MIPEHSKCLDGLRTIKTYYTKCLDGLRTIDTLVHYVFRQVAYNFILWYTQYFDGCRTIYTFVYLAFLWSAYYWYFSTLRVSIGFLLLILF